jgi:hypothetical protein
MLGLSDGARPIVVSPVWISYLTLHALSMPRALRPCARVYSPKHTTANGPELARDSHLDTALGVLSNGIPAAPVKGAQEAAGRRAPTMTRLAADRLV